MSFRFDPSHRVADRGLAESEGGDPSIRVDNAVAAVALDHGDEVRVRASPKALRSDPAAAEAFAALERVPRSERRDADGADDRRDDGSERRARLPEDREAVEALLDFEGRFADDEDAWVARLFGVEEYTVFAGGTPLYHSIPHEGFVRDLNDAVPGFVDDAAAAVADVPGVAVLPVDPLVRWTVDGAEYELNAENLRVPGDGEDRWRWFDLSKLTYVRAVPERGELALQWAGAGGTSLVVRARKRFTRIFTGDPPTRLAAPGEALRDLTRTLARLREELGYEFVVDAAGLADGDDSHDGDEADGDDGATEIDRKSGSGDPSGPAETDGESRDANDPDGGRRAND